MKEHKIIAINLGSTSTEIAYYKNKNCLFKKSFIHSAEELNKYSNIGEQFEYRKNLILELLDKHGLKIEKLDAVVTRGGHTEPIVGGTYQINEKMLNQSASEKFGNYATDLGLKIAYDFSKLGPKAFTVDPPVTDEFEPLARLSGLPQISRRSSFHLLNQRAVGKQYAEDLKIDYNTLNLVGIHMGGGISVAVHKKGMLVDANNAIDGDGPFSTNRCGSLPAGDLVKLCFSGEYTLNEVKKMLNGKGGLMAYLGENDVIAVEKIAKSGDEKYIEVIDAMCYQIAKEIGSCATVINGKVDAIIFTGGIANSSYIVNKIKERVEFIAPVVVYPGEYEMQSLALNTLAALKGEIEIKELR
jgi:butyrate kinase